MPPENIDGVEDEIIALRHALHREPELGMVLPGTREKILAALDGLRLEIALND